MGIQIQKRADYVHAKIIVFHQQSSTSTSCFRRPWHHLAAAYHRRRRAPFWAVGRAVARVRYHLRSTLPLLPQPPWAFQCV